jgi:hypothetical protein
VLILSRSVGNDVINEDMEKEKYVVKPNRIHFNSLAHIHNMEFSINVMNCVQLPEAIDSEWRSTLTFGVDQRDCRNQSSRPRTGTRSHQTRKWSSE